MFCSNAAASVPRQKSDVAELRGWRGRGRVCRPAWTCLPASLDDGAPWTVLADTRADGAGPGRGRRKAAGSSSSGVRDSLRALPGGSTGDLGPCR